MIYLPQFWIFLLYSHASMLYIIQYIIWSYMKIIIEIRSCDDVMDAHFIWDKEMMTKGIKNLIF